MGGAANFNKRSSCNRKTGKECGRAAVLCSYYKSENRTFRKPGACALPCMGRHAVFCRVLSARGQAIPLSRSSNWMPTQRPHPGMAAQWCWGLHSAGLWAAYFASH